jgi:hypothetical protein
MRHETESSAAPEEALEYLDDLIVMFHNRIVELNNEKKLIVKPGDFMKMIELRNKLAPSKSEQQEFWARIAKIRQDSLKKAAEPAPAAKSKKKSKESFLQNENE